jgi:hypothetical protein
MESKDMTEDEIIRVFETFFYSQECITDADIANNFIKLKNICERYLNFELKIYNHKLYLISLINKREYRFITLPQVVSFLHGYKLGEKESEFKLSHLASKI